MKKLEVKRPSVATIMGRFGYGLDRSHENHRTLTDIDILFYECSSIYDLTGQAILATQLIRCAADVRFVEIMGGSSYRAGLDEAEIRTWFHAFARELGLVCAVMVAHRRTTGRFDFHILAPAFDRDGRSLTRRECRKLARVSAAKATERLNVLRLKEGRFVIANIRRQGYVSQVFYLKRDEVPSLEPELPAPSAPFEPKPEVAAVPGQSGVQGAQAATLGAIPATAKASEGLVSPPAGPSRTVANEPPLPARGGADVKSPAKAEPAPKPPGPQGPAVPGSAMPPSDDEEKKRREKERRERERLESERRERNRQEEEERLRQLRELRDRCVAEDLFMYLHSLELSGTGDGARPPDAWLGFAERANLYVPDPHGKFSARQFVETVLPKLVPAMMALAGGIPEAQRALVARCLELRDSILEPPEQRRGARDREL